MKSGTREKTLMTYDKIANFINLKNSFNKEILREIGLINYTLPYALYRAGYVEKTFGGKFIIKNNISLNRELIDKACLIYSRVNSDNRKKSNELIYKNNNELLPMKKITIQKEVDENFTSRCIAHLKSLGYKILKPVQEFTEV